MNSLLRLAHCLDQSLHSSQAPALLTFVHGKVHWSLLFPKLDLDQSDAAIADVQIEDIQQPMNAGKRRAVADGSDVEESR